jgi:hypothetical protein
MADERPEEQGFRVVDRRIFSSDGTRREVPGEEVGKEAAAPQAAPKPEATSDRAAQSTPEEASELPEGAFETLVSYLSTTALFQLGLLEGPGGDRIPPDLPNARRTIDLLAVLKQKTRGNLTPAEAGFLDQVLYELQMSCVEIEKQSARRGR